MANQTAFLPFFPTDLTTSPRLLNFCTLSSLATYTLPSPSVAICKYFGFDSQNFLALGIKNCAFFIPVFTHKQFSLVTKCNVHGFRTFNDPYWTTQLSGRMLHKHLECSNLSVVDSNCQLVAAPGGGGVGELTCGGSLSHYCDLEN